MAGALRHYLDHPSHLTFDRESHGATWSVALDDGPTKRRILIDGGSPATYPRLKKRIKALSPADRHFDLFVVTHIDSDHIGGAVKLMDNALAGLSFGDVWLNG